MGRRSEMESEDRPIEEKIVEIVASSDYRGLRFADVVQIAEKAGISRATVARYLNDMVGRGILKKDGAYRLAMEAISWKHAQRSVFSVLAMHLFDDLFEQTGRGGMSDEEFIRLFTGRIGLLALYTLLVGLEKAEKHPMEGGRWVEEAFGTLIQKDGWRACLNRQVFGGIVKLKSSIRLEQPLTPEIIVDGETIYVKPPSAIQPGLAGKVFKELPPIPKDQLNLLKTCLKRLYPDEVKLLDDVSVMIDKAAAQGKRKR